MRQAVIACNDYLRVGPGRSLRTLYAPSDSNGERKRANHPAPSTLMRWSVAYGWQARAEEYDAVVEAEKTALAEAERKAVMEQGLALDYKRVQKLKRLGEFLEQELYATEPVGRKVQDLIREEQVEAEVAEAEIRDGARPPWMTRDPDEDMGEFRDAPEGERYKNVWLRDYKGIAGVAYEIERFNAPLIAQYRGTLEDIAKEKGDRKQKTELSGPDGGAIPVADLSIDSVVSALGQVLRTSTPEERVALLRDYERYVAEGEQLRNRLLGGTAPAPEEDGEEQA